MYQHSELLQFEEADMFKKVGEYYSLEDETSINIYPLT